MISETLAGQVRLQSNGGIVSRTPTRLDPNDLGTRICPTELCSFRKRVVFEPHLCVTVLRVGDESPTVNAGECPTVEAPRGRLLMVLECILKTGRAATF